MKFVCEIPLNVTHFEQSKFNWNNQGSRRRSGNSRNDSNADENRLFVFEEGKRLRLFSLQQPAASSSSLLVRELQSASVAQARRCTHFAWNRNSTLLALVVDRKQVYFWHLSTNKFTQFKMTSSNESSSAPGSGGISGGGGGGNYTSARQQKEVELLAWSRQTDRLAICCSSGQILLCEMSIGSNACVANWTNWKSNSECCLKKIISLEVSEFADLFACTSIMSELLVMTFDGQTKYYSEFQTSFFNPKFSPPSTRAARGAPTGSHSKRSPSAGASTAADQAKFIWFAYQSDNDGLYLKRISLGARDDDEICGLVDDCVNEDGTVVRGADSAPEFNILHDHEDGPSSSSYLIDFHWLDSQTLLACFSSGSVRVLRIRASQSDKRQSTKELIRAAAAAGQPQHKQDWHPSFRANEEEKFSILARRMQSPVVAASPDKSDEEQRQDAGNQFKLVECKRLLRQPRQQSPGKTFALIATTDSHLFYYQLYETTASASTRSATTSAASRQYRLEQIDDLDLSSSLSKLQQMQIELVQWNHDCSLLAIQLSSGHILIYRTRLEHYLMASCNSRTAFASAHDEITVLNYESSSSNKRAALSPSEHENAATAADENALILKVNLRPSALAVGPNHLALALNNRVRFYSLDSGNKDRLEATTSSFQEQEFLTIISELNLSGEFVAILFDDGRLKLQRIPTISVPNKQAEDADDRENERFFPDPLKQETLSCFLLTEDLLVYCTKQRQIVQFSLSKWQVVQVCNYGGRGSSSPPPPPMRKLFANKYGNKFICLPELDENEDSELDGSSDVYLLDLYTNQLISVVRSDDDDDEEQSTPNDASTIPIERLFSCQLNEVLKVLPHNFATNLMDRKSSPLLDYLDSSAQRFRNHPSKGRIQDAVWDSDGRSVLLIERELVHVIALLDHTLASERPTAHYVGTTTKPTNYKILYASQGIVSYQTILGRTINSILETHDDDLRLSQLESSVQGVRYRFGLSSGDKPRQEEDIPERVEVYLEAQLECQLLKLNYLSSILPVSSLTKCNEICAHLMSDELFNVIDGELLKINQQYAISLQMINQLLWRHLATWSIYCWNLKFGLMIFGQHNMRVHANWLSQLIQGSGDSRNATSSLTRQELTVRLRALFDYQ